jgi:hypothetical protein
LPPELSKLEELDKELTAVARNESEPVDKRVKEYEELLASYKGVVEKLKKYEDATSERSAKDDDEGDDDDDDEMSKMRTVQLEDLLKNGGVKFEKDRVFIPLKKDDKIKRKRSSVSYSRETFEKVVNFLKHGSKVYTNHLVRHVAQKLLDLVKDSVDVSAYPGFADVAGVNTASFTGLWTRF